MSYDYHGAEAEPLFVTSLDALAAMYAENLSVPRSTNLLFLFESAEGAFTRGDLGLAELAAKRDYARSALTGLMSVGLMEKERGARKDANNHPIAVYSPTAEFHGVVADYNGVYLSILGDMVCEHPRELEEMALSGLAGAYKLQGVPLAEVPVIVSRYEKERCRRVGEGGVVRRACAALATQRGVEESVQGVITELVAQVHDVTYEFSPRQAAAARLKAATEG